MTRKTTAKKRTARKTTRATKRTTRTPKKTETSEEQESFFEGGLQSETMRGVWGILAIAAAIFFTLAGFELAGKFGHSVHVWLNALFGVGYALIPLFFLLLAVMLFRSFNNHELGAVRIASAFVFVLAGLGLIGTLADARGGLLGQLVSAPLVYFVDRLATIVILIAIAAVSLVIAFDAHPLSFFSRVRDRLNDDEEDEDLLEEDEAARVDQSQPEDDEPEAEPAPAPEPEEKKEKKGGIFTFGGDTEKSEGDGMFAFPTVAVAGAYTPPPISLLQKDKGRPSVGDVKASANTIKRTLHNFGIDVEMDEVAIGPTVTQYAMKPAEGVRLAKIVSLQSNLELALAATPIRIEAPIPGKSLVGIEVPNNTKSMLGLGSLFGSKEFQSSDKPLLIALGRDIAGNPHFANISKMPHLLIAGATGAGKSVTVHDLIVSLLYRRSPQELRFIMVDPKRVELTLYNSIPHLLTPVITDPKKAILALKWLAKEMDRRYDILEAEKVRDIGSYHKNVYEPALAKHKKSGDEDASDVPEPMPYIVAIIDELSDLMQAYPRELEAAIVRLAQMSRAVGIHLILSTQRPSVQVITGLIKANIPARIALQVSSQIDSRTILDMGGAEKLLGAGDMLYLSGEMSKPRRIQAPYISEEELKAVVKHLADTHAEELTDEIDLSDVQHDTSIFSASMGGGGDDDDDELYEEAKQVIIEAGKGSTSFLQRKLRIGYARAARLMDILEERGVVGPADGSKPREVIMEPDVDDADTDDYDTSEEDGSDDEPDDDAVRYDDDEDEEDERR